MKVMTERTLKRPEVLAPAGTLEKLKVAIRYGADAVYIGGNAYGLRSRAGNFTPEEMAEGVAFAREHNAKVYVAANMVTHEGNQEGAGAFFRELRDIGISAVIVSDPALIEICATEAPGLPIHLSTQASATNYETLEFWKNEGLERVVLAREVSMEEVAAIRENTDIEIEAFIHGAMCISYSGRCLLSSFMAGRDANKGACTHPCRWKYAVMEENRPGQYMPIEENERGTYIFNSKDLCMIEHIPELIDAGIDSFKIEGRMKTALYVATVARTYRMAIDDYLEDPKKYEMNLPKYRTFISQCTYRQYTTGFFFGKPDETTQIYDCNVYERDYVYLGIVGDQVGKMEYSLEQKNKFYQGQKIEVMKADGNDIEVEVVSIKDEEGNEMESCPHPKQKLKINLGIELSKGDILRVKEQ